MPDRPVLEIMLGAALLIVVMIVHGFGMYAVMHRFELNWRHYAATRSELLRQLFLGRLIAIMLLVHLIEILSWAIVLKIIGALHDLRTAFYFAGETYTTVGFGDVLLSPAWRQLALFIAISGLFSFGWSTGVLVRMVGRSYAIQFVHLRHLRREPGHRHARRPAD